MQIKKADSKGRLSGFFAGSYYRVGHEGFDGVQRVRPVYDFFSDLPTITEEAQNYLREFGIDPLKILRSNATPEGYDELVLDSDGNRTYEYGKIVTKRKPWPADFDYNELERLAMKFWKRNGS